MNAYLQGLPAFLTYFVTAIALLTVFIALYLRVTRYPELKLIGEGNLAAACALGGAVLGFALPLASCIAHSVNLADMALWGTIAMLTQGATYLVARRILPELDAGIVRDVRAHGLFLGSLSLAVGLITAACVVG